MENSEKQASPTLIWTQIFDFLGTFANQMKAEYGKRMRENNQFTLEDIALVKKQIFEKLDYINK